MLDIIKRVFRRETDHFAEAFKSAKKRCRNKPPIREKEDHLLDCIGKKVADIHVSTWYYDRPNNIVIAFADGSKLTISSSYPNNAYRWKLEEA